MTSVCNGSPLGSVGEVICKEPSVSAKALPLSSYSASRRGIEMNIFGGPCDCRRKMYFAGTM